jgi:hypothetical protein
VLNGHLIDFYTANDTDHKGRTWEDLIDFSNEKFESTHDFIQWLFPTITPSSYNEHAPVLSESTIEFLKHNRLFRARFEKSIERFFSFLGISIASYAPMTISIEHRPWMMADNHNLLRISRVLESCRLFGFESIGWALFDALIKTVKTNPEWYFIEPENLYHWYRSVSGAKI